MKNTKQKPIRIELLPEDFIGANYINPVGCPLCNAMKRIYPGIDWRVGGEYIRIDHKNGERDYRYTFDSNREWNCTISDSVEECYKQGDKTIYYVPVYPVK